MLVQLRIVDYAIIDEVELAPGPGFNVLTGETGAGKSIIVGAVGLLRGGRASPEVVRAGRDEAVIEALFDVGGCDGVRRKLERAGIAGSTEGELVVRRVIPATGRSRAHANGGLCTLATLGEVVGSLIDISGQHEHQLLSDRRTQRQMLDAMGVSPALLASVSEAHQRIRRCTEVLRRDSLDERQRATRIDFLRFQIGEIEDAGLVAGEDVALEAERSRLQRATELAQAASTGEQELYSAEGAVVERLARLQRQLQGLAAIDPRLEPFARQLEEGRVIVEDVALSLRAYARGVELDPSRLEQVEARLDRIQQLRRKHGSSVDEILARLAEMREELSSLQSFEQHVSSLEAELAEARHQAETAAAALTAERHQAAARLAEGVAEQLAPLRMAGARMSVEVSPRSPRPGDDPALVFDIPRGGDAQRAPGVDQCRLGVSGWDQIEILIATNAGEGLRPLALIASGGELSRIMLALRRVLGRSDPVPTSIYDEVDAGIGGAVADVVGRSLAEVSRHRQVLCVTHLPQVAAHADRHFHVGKTTIRRRTRVAVRQLTPEERVEELARMLGGEQVSDAARANARQLLKAAARH